MGKLFLGAVFMTAVILDVFLVLVVGLTCSAGLSVIIAVVAGLIVTAVAIAKADHPTPYMIVSNFVVAVAASLAAVAITCVASAQTEKVVIGVIVLVFATAMSYAAAVIVRDYAKISGLPARGATIIALAEFVAVLATMMANMS